jgi:hypothetical protein
MLAGVANQGICNLLVQQRGQEFRSHAWSELQRTSCGRSPCVRRMIQCDSAIRPESPEPSAMFRNAAPIERDADATLLSSYFDIPLPRYCGIKSSYYPAIVGRL